MSDNNRRIRKKPKDHAASPTYTVTYWDEFWDEMDWLRVEQAHQMEVSMIVIRWLEYRQRVRSMGSNIIDALHGAEAISVEVSRG